MGIGTLKTGALNAPGVQDFAYEEKGPCVCVSQHKDERSVQVIIQRKGEGLRDFAFITQLQLGDGQDCLNCLQFSVYVMNELREP
ncbi:hypothetical protein VULLAG_LOCUS1513 [Vulpes lagopus]